MAEIDAIFDTCVAQLNSGAAVEACLALVPAEASEVAPLLQIAVALRSLAVPVPEVDARVRQEARSRFLAHARALGEPALVTVEVALDESVGQLAAGGTIEQCIDAYPHYAAELRSLLDTVAGLQGHQAATAPAQRDPESAAHARAQFLSSAHMAGQRAVSVEDALDTSIQMLAAGATIDSCVDTFPQHAAELRALLETVAFARNSHGTTPARPRASVLSARQTFLDAAASLKPVSAAPVAGPVRQTPARPAKAPSAPWWRPLADLLGQPAWRGAFAAVMVLVLLLGFGRSAVTVASGALPGDTLYPVKRLAEQTRLVLTVDSAQREQLQSQYDQTRRLEADRVAAQGRQVLVELPGVIASITGNVWTIFGLEEPVLLTSETIVQGVPAVGKAVWIQAWSDGQGNLVARQALILPDEPPEQRSVDTPVPPPAVITPRGGGVLPPRPTPLRPTPTDSPWPTETVAVVITSTATSTPTLTATPSATVTTTPSASPSATPTGTPGGLVPVEFTGFVDEIHPNWWRVSGRTVRIDEDTTIDESLGAAEPDAEVRVAGFELPQGGGILARSIVVTQPAAGPQITEFTGRIIAMNGDIWQIGDTLVDVSGATMQGTGGIGKVATVRAKRRGGEMWRAEWVRVQEDPDPFYVEGEIEAFSGASITVNGTSMAIDPDTQFSGLSPAVGLWAEVTVVARSDGYHAQSIYVYEPPTATPAPTDTETPAPTTTPAPTDTETPAPTVTPTPTSAPTDTATPEPPTDTPEPPTPTPEPPTSTPEPPTATPEPPTATPEPPTATPEPPTATPEPPTATPEPGSVRLVVSSADWTYRLVFVVLCLPTWRDLESC